MEFASDIESYMRSLPEDLEILIRGWNDEERIRDFMLRRSGIGATTSTDNKRPIPYTGTNVPVDIESESESESAPSEEKMNKRKRYRRSFKSVQPLNERKSSKPRALSLSSSSSDTVPQKIKNSQLKQAKIQSEAAKDIESNGIGSLGMSWTSQARRYGDKHTNKELMRSFCLNRTATEVDILLNGR